MISKVTSAFITDTDIVFHVRTDLTSSQLQIHMKRVYV